MFRNKYVRMMLSGTYSVMHSSAQFMNSLGGQDRILVRCPHCHHKGVGSNPTATRNENWTWEDPQHKRSLNSSAGFEWKTSDVKLIWTLKEKKKEKEKEKEKKQFAWKCINRLQLFVNHKSSV